MAVAESTLASPWVGSGVSDERAGQMRLYAPPPGLPCRQIRTEWRDRENIGRRRWISCPLAHFLAPKSKEGANPAVRRESSSNARKAGVGERPVAGDPLRRASPASGRAV